MLGKEVKCRITGFQGIAVAETNWIFGCTRYGVQGEELKDSLLTEAQWFDSDQLEVVGKGLVEEEWVGTAQAAPTGGPGRESGARAIETG